MPTTNDALNFLRRHGYDGADNLFGNMDGAKLHILRNVFFAFAHRRTSVYNFFLHCTTDREKLNHLLLQ